ncbi:MAG: hypothetical protein JXR77_00625, partial [Lentisphaeria bacterium]|nr:hypothetical protein [Lentisphaeria bacterium]
APPAVPGRACFPDIHRAPTAGKRAAGSAGPDLFSRTSAAPRRPENAPPAAPGRACFPVSGVSGKQGGEEGGFGRPGSTSGMPRE